MLYASSLDEGPKYVAKKSKMKSFYERSLNEEYEEISGKVKKSSLGLCSMSSEKECVCVPNLYEGDSGRQSVCIKKKINFNTPIICHLSSHFNTVAKQSSTDNMNCSSNCKITFEQ